MFKQDEKPTYASFNLHNNTEQRTVARDSANVVNHNVYKMCLWSLLCIADPFTMYFQLQVLPLFHLKIRFEERFKKILAFTQLSAASLNFSCCLDLQMNVTKYISNIQAYSNKVFNVDEKDDACIF